MVVVAWCSRAGKVAQRPGCCCLPKGLSSYSFSSCFFSSPCLLVLRPLLLSPPRLLLQSRLESPLSVRVGRDESDDVGGSHQSGVGAAWCLLYIAEDSRHGILPSIPRLSLPPAKHSKVFLLLAGLAIAGAGRLNQVQMPTIIVSVDLDCSRCRTKIQKVLNRIQEKGEFCIDDIDFDEKNNKVKVTGPFDPDKLADKLCCKACKIIKQIEIVEPPPPPPPKPKEEPKKEEPAPPPPDKKEQPAPPPLAKVDPPPPQPPKEDKPAPPPPPKEEKPAPPPPPKEEKPAPPPPKVVEVPYPWPYPYPFPAWPSECCCHGHGGHGGCSCGGGKAPEPAPAPPPPQYVPMPQYVPQPYPCNPCGGGYRIVCEEDPSYACAIM